MLSRFLYDKNDLQNILVHSLLFPIESNVQLQKTIIIHEPAYFWAYELYYSGFINELYVLLWKIHYDFYAILYIELTEYLDTNLTIDNLKQNQDLLGIIIHNFLYYRPNLDIYLLSKINNHLIDSNIIKTMDKITFDTPINIIIHFIDHLINTSIDKLFEIVYHFIDIQESFEYFKHKILNCNLLPIIGLKKIIIFLILLFTYKVKTKSNVIEIFNIHYKFTFSYLTNNIKTYNILSQRPDINSNAKYISLLCYIKSNTLKENISNDITIKKHFNDWIYKASFTPFWKINIEKYGGKIQNIHKTILWENDDLFEVFSNKFDLEPDEQSIHTLSKGFINTSNKELNTLSKMILNYYNLFPTFHIINTHNI